METKLKAKYTLGRTQTYKRPPKTDKPRKLAGKKQRICLKCGQTIPEARQDKKFLCTGRKRVKSVSSTTRCRGLGTLTGDPKARAEQKKGTKAVKA